MTTEHKSFPAYLQHICNHDWTEIEASARRRKAPVVLLYPLRMEMSVGKAVASTERRKAA